MKETLSRYVSLLVEVDRWFASCLKQFSKQLACGRGCSACCRGLFDISLADAALLREGFQRLPEELRAIITEKALSRIKGIQTIWPEFAPPYLLNTRPEEAWSLIMPEDDETPCVLLDTGGLCLLYDYRPLTCRLHGLPQVDHSGEILDDQWCPLNFSGADPLTLPELRGDFADIFRKETQLIADFALQMTGVATAELDTLIPAALLVDWLRQE